ncbi:MAG: glycosyltransferase family 9 protein [Gemmatimonadota bacterium]|nr:glycosyltransferase family 9 protein [Gemmatimonadota bacterium]
MAQTRTITKKKLAALGVLDFASRALRGVLRPKPPLPGTPRSFLVVEPWGIGDVVLATALLKALRANFPGAGITLLAKPHARELLAESGLVDDVVVFDFPWTAFTGKLQPNRYIAREFQQLLRALRSHHFDVSLDARRDVRSNVITYLAGARRRIGYDFGGGSHLLTDVLPSGTQNEHKVSDWLALLGPLGIEERNGFSPSLAVTESEKETARHRLGALGLSTERPIVGVHPGASQKVRHWDPDRFAAVIGRIALERGAQVVLFEEKEGDSAGIAPSAPVQRIQSDLRGFMALVTQCDLLLCSDSGPMHIASALGVPVTALFGPQRSEWYGPRGEYDRVVRVEEMACRPCFDACIFATPHCMEGITTDAVTETVIAQLDRIESRNGEVARHG